jgi:AsmA protein
MTYALLALGCLLAGTAAFLFVAAPVDFVRDGLIERVKARTGRDLTAGSASLSFSPTLAVSVPDVVLSPPPGMRGAPTVVIPTLEAHIDVWSLLTRRLNLSRLTLHKPTIELRIDETGRRSWDLAQGTSGPLIRLAQAATETRTDAAPPESAARPVRIRQKIGLEDVRIVNGTIRYRDDRRGISTDIENVNLALALPDQEGPLQITGDLAWQREAIALEGHVSSFRALLERQPVLVDAVVRSAPANVAFKGNLGTAGVVSLEGDLAVSGTSSRRLAAWIGQRDPSEGDDPFEVSGQARIVGADAALTAATVMLGKTRLAGDLSIAHGGERPLVRGKLRTAELDLGALVALAGRTEAPNPAAPAAPPKAEVRGFLQRGPWREAPIDLSVLSRFDADIAVEADRARINALSFDGGQFSLAMAEGQAKLSVADLKLYGGHGQGAFTLDRPSGAPLFHADLTLDDVDAEPFLNAAAGSALLAGKARLTATVSGTLGSERQFVETLSGKAGLLVANGALMGFDVYQTMKKLMHARVGELAPSPTDKTRFSELAATFAITNGIAESRDMRMSSQAVQVTGAGRIDLVQRLTDYTLRPKLTLPTTAGRTAAAPASIEVPIRIHGPWDHPTYTPDLQTVIKNPGQVLETVKEIGKNLKGENVEGAVKGLMSGDKAERKKAREALREMFRK